MQFFARHVKGVSCKGILVSPLLQERLKLKLFIPCHQNLNPVPALNVRNTNRILTHKPQRHNLGWPINSLRWSNMAGQSELPFHYPVVGTQLRGEVVNCGLTFRMLGMNQKKDSLCESVGHGFSRGHSNSHSLSIDPASLLWCQLRRGSRRCDLRAKVPGIFGTGPAAGQLRALKSGEKMTPPTFGATKKSGAPKLVGMKTAMLGTAVLRNPHVGESSSYG